MDEPEPKSRIHRLEKPVFESKIPPHLVSRMTEQERWLVDTLSRLDQKADWLLERALEFNESSRDIDVRVSRLEKFTGKWAVVGGIAIMVVTAFLSAGAKTIISHLFP